MSWLDRVHMALEGILLHGFRSGLTMLGIIFGVGAVVAMNAIGAGARDETLRRIQQVGATTVLVRAVRMAGEQLKDAKRALSPGLSPGDVESMRSVGGAIRVVVPFAPVPRYPVRFRGRELRARPVGTTEDMLRITRRAPAAGRFLTRRDLELRSPVAVLGHGVAREMGVTDPVGRTLRLGRMLLTVVGVLPPDDDAGIDAGVRLKDRDGGRGVYIPLGLALEAFPGKEDPPSSEEDARFAPLDEVVLQVDAIEDLPATRAFLERMLARRHHGVADTYVVVPYEILRQSQQAQEIFNLVMAMIAGLSLLVGGIGIMNIMLANVSERTKEIGIKRALGASESDVMLEFLVEAVTLSVLGGVLGTGLGAAIAASVSFSLGWKTLVTLESVALAFAVSALVGIAFGSFPARTAAALDPIQALRYE